MEEPIQPSTSTYTQSRRRRPRKAGKADAVPSSPLVEAAEAPIEAIVDAPILASSSKLPVVEGAPQGASKRKTRKGKEPQDGSQPVAPSASVADLPRLSRREKKELKAQREAAAAAAAANQLATGLLKGEEASDAEDSPEEATRRKCIPLTQGGPSRIPHVWSKDGRFYFTVSGTSVNVHSSTSPSFSRLSVLSSPQSHLFPITALVLHPANPLHLITASSDGCLRIWDWVEGRLVRSIRVVRGSTAHICVGQIQGSWNAFVTGAYRKAGKKKKADGSHLSHRIFRVPLSSNGPITPVDVGKLSSPASAIFISPSFAYLIALSANKAYAFRLSDLPHGKAASVKFVSDQILTCGAFSPPNGVAGKEEWFATGDQRGVIRLWHGLEGAFRQLEGSNADPESERRLPTTSLHWHAHAVAALAFIPSGAQLLSAGEESVLVQWHLASGKREYIPRLGGRPIVSLTVRQGARGAEEEWWMALADGGVVRVGAASGKVHNVGQAVRLDPLRPKADVSYPMTIHPATSALVVPSSHPSTLQFIDTVVRSVLFDLEVAPSNRISRRDEKEIEPVRVECVAFSVNADGGSRWMATMEARKADVGEGGGSVRNLKLWQWDAGRYAISTQFPKPHGGADLRSMMFGPTPPVLRTSGRYKPNPYLLTAAADGTAKLWQVRQARKSDHGKSGKSQAVIEHYWALRSVFDYRGMPIHATTFSPDGTIVALAHGPVVSLWDVESNALLRSLEGTGAREIRKVIFVGKEGRYLVGAGEKGLVIWDLLSCNITWTWSTNAITHLIAYPSQAIFVAAHQSLTHTTYLVFDSASPEPIRENQVPHVFRNVVLVPAKDSSNTAPSLHLIGVAESGEIFRFGDAVNSVATHTNAIRPEAQKTSSVWQEMFGKDAFLDELDAGATQLPTVARPRSGRPVDVFEGPSHTMPPVGLLFDAFMEQILVPRSAVAEADVTADVAMGRSSAVVYLQEDEVMPAQEVERVKGRDVPDEEVKELEQLFRDVLASMTSSTKVNGRANGHRPGVNAATTFRTNGVSSSDSESDGESDDEENSFFRVAPLASTRQPKRAALIPSPSKAVNGMVSAETVMNGGFAKMPKSRQDESDEDSAWADEGDGELPVAKVQGEVSGRKRKAPASGRSRG